MKGLSFKSCAALAASLSLLVALAMATGAPQVGWFSLRQATIQAFTNYILKTEAQNAETLRQGPFLWVDGLTEKERTAAMAALRGGEVHLRRLSVDEAGANIEVTGGLIHDWQGIIFIPGVKLDDVLKVLQDYDHHATYYAPDVAKARTESRKDDQFRVFLRFRRQMIIAVVLDTEHEVNYYRDSPLREHSRSSAVRIAQVEDPGGPHEKEDAPGEDNGYLWRMETWWRMEERDGGVYVQNQVVTLTRDIPTGLGWVIGPFITKIPKEKLEFTLQATKKAVLNNRAN